MRAAQLSNVAEQPPPVLTTMQQAHNRTKFLISGLLDYYGSNYFACLCVSEHGKLLLNQSDHALALTSQKHYYQFWRALSIGQQGDHSRCIKKLEKLQKDKQASRDVGVCVQYVLAKLYAFLRSHGDTSKKTTTTATKALSEAVTNQLQTASLCADEGKTVSHLHTQLSDGALLHLSRCYIHAEQLSRARYSISILKRRLLAKEEVDQSNGFIAAETYSVSGQILVRLAIAPDADKTTKLSLLKKAKVAFQRAIEVSGGMSLGAQYGLYLMYSAQKQHEKALEALTKAIQMLGNLPLSVAFDDALRASYKNGGKAEFKNVISKSAHPWRAFESEQLVLLKKISKRLVKASSSIENEEDLPLSVFYTGKKQNFNTDDLDSKHTPHEQAQSEDRISSAAQRNRVAVKTAVSKNDAKGNNIIYSPFVDKRHVRDIVIHMDPEAKQRNVQPAVIPYSKMNNKQQDRVRSKAMKFALVSKTGATFIDSADRSIQVSAVVVNDDDGVLLKIGKKPFIFLRPTDEEEEALGELQVVRSSVPSAAHGLSIILPMGASTVDLYAPDEVTQTTWVKGLRYFFTYFLRRTT